MKKWGGAQRIVADADFWIRRAGILAAPLLVFLFILGAASAIAGEQNENPPILMSPDIEQAFAGEGTSPATPDATDSDAADGMPLSDLGRTEALELLEGVFSAQLEAPAGILDELEVERFLAPNVAVIPSSDAPSPAASEEGSDPSIKEDAQGDSEGEGDPEGEEPHFTGPRLRADEIQPYVNGATLLNSTVPLRVEGPSGQAEPVDLSLKPTDGELQSAAPLVEVGLPQDLGEGINLPAQQVQVELANAPEGRSPSTVDKSVAFYPNVAEDTDFAVAPTPTGFETLTQLRSPEAPPTQTLNLDLPQGAVLAEADNGGAHVTLEDEILLGVAPPTALDAGGSPVPVKLSVSGSSLRLEVEPEEATEFPVLVDPLFQTYEWNANNNKNGMYGSTSHEEWSPETYSQVFPIDIVRSEEITETWVPLYPGEKGLVIRASGEHKTGDHTNWIYTVPRYFSDKSLYGNRPTSFISHMTLSNLVWQAWSNYLSPYLFAGIWDPTTNAWVSSFSHESLEGHGLTDMSWQYQFSNTKPDTDAQVGSVGIYATENRPSGAGRVYVGTATVELADIEAPQQPVLSTTTPPWVNQAPTSIWFTATDTGLGAFSVTASTEQLGTNGQPLNTWKASYGCPGVGDAACPRQWTSSESNHPQLTIEPALLPTGVNYINVVAEDPVGNKSKAAPAEVRVDHTAPVLAFTGSMTEQEQLGTRRAAYTLKANGADGNAEYPQSGIAKAEVKLDGKAVAMEGKRAEEWSPKCASQNCALAAEWTLNTGGLAEGNHTVEVIASDAVGNSTTKTLTIETHSATPPTLALSGSMTEQASLGTSRPRYILKAKSVATAAGSEAPMLGGAPAYSSSIGSFGTGNGQFYTPADVAADAKGNLWALDKSNNRLQKFNENGEWVLTAGVGKLSSPSALALDASGNVWVADTGSNRVVEFKENGEFLRTFGTNVNKTKVEAGGTLAEKNLCTAASGNVCQAATAGSLAGQLKAPQGIAVTSTSMIWVVDYGNGRLEKFDMSGTYSSSLSSEGSEPGKLKEPKAMTISPDGSLWVADYGNNRIQQWVNSIWVRAIGTEGSGAAQFKGPAAIEADSTGNIWVGDQKNNRVEQFDRTGVYLNQFGSGGGGSGQFSFGASMGLTVDRLGSIWVTDPGHFKVQRWLIPGFPVYSSSIGGTSGTGNGQFSNVADVAADAKGNIWALDKESNRLQKFNEKGEWVLTAGSAGTGAGKLSSPSALALDGAANVWVADTANNRIVEFNEKGEFVKTFGTNVNKTKVEASGTETERNLCTAASGNVCQAATAGSLAGQLKSPKGIALTSGGNIWIADTGNSRIEKFTPSGGLINNLSGEGTEPGRLKEPLSIAVAPDGSIWVADTGNNRIEQWNSSLAFLRAVGKEGSAGGEFKGPAAIEADSSGNIWVGDQKNSRVEEFAEGGKYLGQFGAEGSGIFTFSAPMGIAIDSSGSIWVTEAGHFKVQKWVQETPRSELTTTLWLDNNQQTGVRGTCKSATCTIEPQWTVESKALSTGSHSAKVKTTDGLGRSTESTISFQIAPDTTKPTIEASGELANAPEGWVEQEAYGFNATATDGGSGVTSITFKIDGTQVASASQTCPDGGCNQTLTKQVSMTSYAGGSHNAELSATDGAGNSSVKSWTINVDPEGHISTAELVDTVEAAESTGSSELLQGEGEEEAPVALKADGEALTAVGGMTPTDIGKDPTAGVSMEILEGEAFVGCEGESTDPCEPPPGGAPDLVPIKVVPTSSASGATEVKSGPESFTAVSANTSAHADTVVRPIYDGDLTFNVIRDVAAPETYSWTVNLGTGATMKAESPQYVQVYYASGHAAFGIAAQVAHDAVGKAVPTKLSVSGNVLTLTVQHRAESFVYPVLAGTGWEGGFVSEVVKGPQDETEIREEEERIAKEKQEELEREMEEEQAGGSPELAHYFFNNQWGVEEIGPAIVGPPEFDAGATASGGAQASGVWVPSSVATRPFKGPVCYRMPVEFPPTPLNPGEPYGECRLTGNTAVRGWVHGHFHYEIPANLVWWKNGREAEIDCGVDHHYPAWSMSPKECHFSGENQQETHIVGRNRWRIEASFGIQLPEVTICLQNHIDLYPNGNVSKNWPDYHHNAVMYPGAGNPCPWSP